jgi:hypothetical protein
MHYRLSKHREAKLVKQNCTYDSKSGEYQIADVVLPILILLLPSLSRSAISIVKSCCNLHYCFLINSLLGYVE